MKVNLIDFELETNSCKCYKVIYVMTWQEQTNRSYINDKLQVFVNNCKIIHFGDELHHCFRPQCFYNIPPMSNLHMQNFPGE